MQTGQGTTAHPLRCTLSLQYWHTLCTLSHIAHNTTYIHTVHAGKSCISCDGNHVRLKGKTGMQQRTQTRRHSGAGHLPVDIKIHPVIQLAFIGTWVCVDTLKWWTAACSPAPASCPQRSTSLSEWRHRQRHGLSHRHLHRFTTAC